MEVKHIAGVKYTLTSEERRTLAKAKNILENLEKTLVESNRLDILLEKIDKKSLSHFITIVLRYGGVPLCE